MKKNILSIIISLLLAGVVYAASGIFTDVKIGSGGLVSNFTNTVGTLNVTTVNKTGTGVVTNWNADRTDSFHASATPAANTIAAGNASGKLAAGWGGTASTLATLDTNTQVVQRLAYEGDASGVATLNASTLVVQNPANASATAGASKIPIANASGKLDDGWGGTASTLATLDTNTQVVQRLAYEGDASGVATLNASTLVVQNPANASATPGASKIPIADAAGKLDDGWGGVASSLATLNTSTLVVQNPANATATPTASKIPIADGSAHLAAGWLGATAITSTPTGTSIPISNTAGKLAAGWGGAASTLATLNASSLVVQNPANAQTTSANGKIPIAGAAGLDPSWDSDRPAFSAATGTNQTGITCSSWTKMQFGDEEFDTGSDYDNVTNYRFTPGVAGKYILTAQLALMASGNTFGYCAIYKNGTIYKAHRAGVQDAEFWLGSRPSLSVVVDANGTSDYFEVFGYADCTSGTITLSHNSMGISFFTGSRL